MAGIKKIGFYSSEGITIPLEIWEKLPPKIRVKTETSQKIEYISGNLHNKVTIHRNYPSISQTLAKDAENNPILWEEPVWLFKGNIYLVKGSFKEEQIKLLIYNEFDKERKLFERLENKFDSGDKINQPVRVRIPEQVRIEVWRRDGGKCVNCGSREKLEYDHIIPVSKGGSNTARNIELLCESCNRSKGAKIT